MLDAGRGGSARVAVVLLDVGVPIFTALPLILFPPLRIPPSSSLCHSLAPRSTLHLHHPLSVSLFPVVVVTAPVTKRSLAPRPVLADGVRY